MKKRHMDRLVVVAAVVVAALGVRSVRSSLFDIERRVNAKHDVYFMPPAKQLVNLSLGYKAALADVLWAHVRVSSGLHTFERRRFENLVRLYDAPVVLVQCRHKLRGVHRLGQWICEHHVSVYPLDHICCIVRNNIALQRISNCLPWYSPYTLSHGRDLNTKTFIRHL